jgi:hypothetical protein
VRGCIGASRTDSQQSSQWHAGRRGARLDHRRRCLARGDHVDRGGAVERVSCVAALERTTNERAGIHRIDGRTQNCDEIVSEV